MPQTSLFILYSSIPSIQTFERNYIMQACEVNFAIYAICTHYDNAH